MSFLDLIDGEEKKPAEPSAEKPADEGTITVDLSKPARKPRKPREPRCTCGFKESEHSAATHPFTPKVRKVREPKAPAERRENDKYLTLDDLALAIVKVVGGNYCPQPEAILEPTSGEGAFIRAARSKAGPWTSDVKIGAVDLVDYREQCVAAGASAFMHSDILNVKPEILKRFDVGIGNPPFKDAARIIDHLLGSNPDMILFFLLPVSYFGATSETMVKGQIVLPRTPAYHKKNEVALFAPIWPRPSFTGDGKTDRMEYGLFGFGRRLVSMLDGCRLLDGILWDPSRYVVEE